MQILGIDPGISTGIVLWDSSKGIIAHYTIREHNPLEIVKTLSKRREHIVLEKAPLFGAHNQLLRCNILISGLISNHNLILLNPAEWKPFAKAHGWAEEIKLPTQHEKDAYCMIQYAFLFKIGRQQ